MREMGKIWSRPPTCFSATPYLAEYLFVSGKDVKMMDETLVTELCLPVRGRGTNRTEIMMLPIRLLTLATQILALAVKLKHYPLNSDTCH